MFVSLALAILGGLLAAPFAVAILRAETPAQVWRIWLVQLASGLALWAVLALIFHSGLIVDQRLRILAALVINLFWVGLVVATVLGTAAAVVRTAQLRRRLRTSGK
jgi:hypothetical protein